MGKLQRNELTGLGLIAGGVLLVSFTLGGYVIGYLIDRASGTAPYGAVIGLLVGFLIGIYDFYRIAVRIMNQQSLPSTTPPTVSPSDSDQHEPTDEK